MNAGTRGRRGSWLLAAVAGLALAGCGGAEEPEMGAGSAVSPVVPERAAIIQDGYVGSQACAGCHAEETTAWQGSRHHAIFRQGGVPAWAGFSPPPYRDDDLQVVPMVTVPGPDEAEARPPEAFMRVERGGATGTFPVDAVIGGGTMESYATHLSDGAWLLLPLSYQVDRRTFSSFTETACGVDALSRTTPRVWQAYDRVWSHRCIDCHVTAGSIGFDPADDTYHTSFIDPGAGCEACHGPGAEHVAAAEAGRGAEGILALGALDPEARLEICASCHALAFPFESRWGGNRPYRPGDDYQQAFLPLLRSYETEPYTKITHEDHTPAMGVMEYQGLVQSLCHLEGGATCTTCHAPHGDGAADHALRAPVGAGALCAGCHQDVVDQGEAHTRHTAGQPGGACVDCHMPPTVEAVGTRLPNHAIDVPVPANNVDYGVPDACTLCHAERGAKWAAQQVGELWGDPETRRRRRLARAFLEEDVDALQRLLRNTDEADLLRADAAAALARSAGTEAVPALIAVLAADDSLLVRRFAADLLGSLGPPAEMPLPERLDHHQKLDDAGVLEALRSIAEEEAPALRLAAAASLARLEASDGIERLEALRAVPVLDDGYRLHQVLGKYYLLGGKLPEAEAEYERVLELSPNYLAVIQDLGFIYFTSERFHEAHAIWMRALALDPDNEELRLSVHLAEDQIRGLELEAADEGR
jgi:predicted CXXCH cytochrome family protein